MPKINIVIVSLHTNRAMPDNTQQGSDDCKIIGYLDLFWGLLCAIAGVLYLVQASSMALQGEGEEKKLEYIMFTFIGFFFMAIAVVDLVTGAILVAGAYLNSRACLIVWLVKVSCSSLLNGV